MRKYQNLLLPTVVIGLVAVTGTVLLLLARAATAPLAQEPEQGSIQGSASVITDASASGGQAVRFAREARFGFSVHTAPQADKAAYLQIAKDANATTVRDDFWWPAIEPQNDVFDWSSSDEIVRVTANAGLRLLAILGNSPAWASSCPADAESYRCGPRSASDYADFAAKVTARYKAGGAFWTENPAVPYVPLAGIEIWNEPNNAPFWKNPSGTAYAQIVKAAYPAIKQADPTVTVLAGSTAAVAIEGESMVTQTFLQQMYAAGAKGFFDAYSHHPYSFGPNWFSNISNYQYSGWSQLEDHSPSIRSIMVANGDGDKKIWATELGTSTATGYTTEAQQQQFATDSIAKWKSFPWAGNYYWYTLHDDCEDAANWDCRYGILRRDGSQKPVYQALRSGFSQ